MHYSEDLSIALKEAEQVADNRHSPVVDVSHLWFVYTRGSHPAADLLNELNISLIEFRRFIARQATQHKQTRGTHIGTHDYSEDLMRLLHASEAICGARKDGIRIADTLIAQLSLTNNDITDYLVNKGVTKEKIVQALAEHKQRELAVYEQRYPTLSRFSIHMNAEAMQGRYVPLIGRYEELQDMFRILSRNVKNNPVLIGHPGVGKTAIVEGFVQRIVAGDVPEQLKGAQVYALNLGAMVAGAKYRGEFEERFMHVLDEVRLAGDKIILFLDELHLLVGANRQDGAIDAGNLLKPLLARGDVCLIGTTTLDEYREYIEKDAGLERRLQKILVQEPDLSDTVRILRGWKQRLQLYHGVRIQDQALNGAAVLGLRYINDRYLPDKAIDLLDEACATVRITWQTKPYSLDAIQRRKKEIVDELSVLHQEQDEWSLRQIHALEQEVAQLSSQEAIDQKQWTHDLEMIHQAQKDDSLQAKKARDYLDSGKSLVRDVVTYEDVAEVVGRLTGVPVMRIVEGEKEKLLRLPDKLRERVIGQEDAISRVANAVIRSRAGVQNPKRPIGSFLFLGPTGVGKTELSRALSEALFDDEANMVRLDMSEYMEKHAVSRLIGAPPGYVGYEEGGQLTEIVRREPYAIILFDEIEKAHRDVYNILLQVMDEGRLTDTRGHVVDFKNTILILTSNIGSDVLLAQGSEDGIIREATKTEVFDLLKEHFRPEFLNRIDDIVLFAPLTQDSVLKIVRKMVHEVTMRLQHRGIQVDVDERVMVWIAAQGFDEQFGARPLQRFIAHHLETPLAFAMIRNDVREHSHIKIGLENNQPVFQFAQAGSHK